MKNIRTLTVVSLIVCSAFLLLAGCTAREEKSAVSAQGKQESGPETVVEKGPSLKEAAVPSTASAPSADVVVSVNDARLTRSELDAELNRRLASARQEIPPAQLQDVKAKIRGQLVSDFIARTLLANEVNRLQIKASEQEVAEAVQRLKSNLPPGITLDDLIKRNKTTAAKMRDEISLEIRINKLVTAQLAGKNKPTEKEVYQFYEDHKDKFKTGESALVRHILIATAKKDDEKVRAEKRAKAEFLRKQLTEGADFAELAAKNSDCPSGKEGGNLGLLYRGQSVKPFEDAAFSQQVKAIGPVVETEYGYHVIQVMEHRPPQQIALDKKIRQDIASFIEQQRQREAFEDLMKKLRAKATIVVYNNK